MDAGQLRTDPSFAGDVEKSNGESTPYFGYSNTKNPAKIETPKSVGGRRLSKSKEDRQQVVHDVGEEILTALQAVFLTAERALAHAPSGTTVNLAVPSNMMVGEAVTRHLNSPNPRQNIARKFGIQPRVKWRDDGVLIGIQAAPDRAQSALRPSRL